jgi:hypothetical protein
VMHFPIRALDSEMKRAWASMRAFVNRGGPIVATVSEGRMFGGWMVVWGSAMDGALESEDGVIGFS